MNSNSLVITPDEWLPLNRHGRDVVHSMEYGFEVRHGRDNGQIYIPSKPRRWPGDAWLLINDVDYGRPHRTAGHGATWDNVGIIPSARVGAPVDEPSPKVDPHRFGEGIIVKRLTRAEREAQRHLIPIPKWPIWTMGAGNYKEWLKIMEELFFIDAPFRKEYFDLKDKWYTYRGPPGSREYYRRHEVKGGWKEFRKIAKVFNEIVECKDVATERHTELLKRSLGRPGWPKG